MLRDVDLTPHHTGYAVIDIDESKRSFESLGFRVDGGPYADGGRNVDILFMKNMTHRIELIAISDETRRSDIDVLMRVRRGPSAASGQTLPYHICFEAGNFDEAINELRERRFVISSQIAPAPALGGRQVVFLYHRNTGLIELLQRERSDGCRQ